MALLSVVGLMLFVTAPATDFDPAMEQAVLKPAMWLLGAGILYSLSTSARSTNLGLALRRGECHGQKLGVLAAGHLLVAITMLAALLRGIESRTNLSQSEELLSVLLTVSGISTALAIALMVVLRRMPNDAQADESSPRVPEPEPAGPIVWFHFGTCLFVTIMVIYLETRPLPT